ncbi:MAG TPA: ABC transporter permease [Thermoanaerobaculia bacterium]|nr:ABC transporter permease [Thermoanaerobaculia bacterium]
MVFLENFRIAFAALRANLMRSILTTLGIIIGVAAVIAVVSIVQGLQFMITQEFQGVGASFIQVTVRQQMPGVATARQVKLTWDDGQAIRDTIPGIKSITPILTGSSQVKYRDLSHRTFVFGVNENYPDVANFGVEYGRFISRIDREHRRKVAVVGQEIIEELELGSEPLGKEIYVGTMPVTIVGVMEDKGQFLGQNRNDLLFLPFDAALSVFGRNAGDQVSLNIQAESAEAVEEVRDGIERVLRRRHGIGAGEEDDFQIIEQDELLDVVSTVLGSVTAVVGGIVSIALLVGGIGIMNIMLVSVTERTREIGVRKAVGARRQDVLVQFLIEAVTLSLVGGAIGLALGYGAGLLAASLIPNFPPAHVPVWAVALAFGFSALVGIFFGIYPAAKASRLDPIDALRYE